MTSMTSTSSTSVLAVNSLPRRPTPCSGPVPCGPQYTVGRWILAPDPSPTGSPPAQPQQRLNRAVLWQTHRSCRHLPVEPPQPLWLLVALGRSSGFAKLGPSSMPPTTLVQVAVLLAPLPSLPTPSPTPLTRLPFGPLHGSPPSVPAGSHRLHTVQPCLRSPRPQRPDPT